MNKIWDIQQPRDMWGRHFALMNYQLLGMQMLFGKKIEVRYE